MPRTPGRRPCRRTPRQSRPPLRSSERLPETSVSLPGITLSDKGGQGEHAHCRRSERPGLPRRSPAEPLRSRPLCTHTPRLWRPQASTAGDPQSRPDCCLSRAIGKDRVLHRTPSAWRCGRTRRRLSGVPDRAPMRESSPAGLTGRPLAGVPSDPEVSRMRFGIWHSPLARHGSTRADFCTPVYNSAEGPPASIGTR